MPRYRTPGTAPVWSNLAEWVGAAWTISKRHHAASHEHIIKSHFRSLPPNWVRVSEDPEALRALLDLLIDGPQCFQRPLRGDRADAPQTPLIVEAKNRLKQLERAKDAIPPGPNWLAMHGPDQPA